jgi:dCMP deaminase
MVILLIIGTLCSGKEYLAKLLEEEYGYKIHKLSFLTFDKIWDSEKKTINTEVKEKIILESRLVLKEALIEWNQSHVIYPLFFSESVKEFLSKRSYIKIVTVNAPMMKRYVQFKLKHSNISLEDFVLINDEFSYSLGLENLNSSIAIFNNFEGRNGLLSEIQKHNIIVNKVFRPVWDSYFMKLAHIVKERSNCMKRSVGAIIVKNNRIISTGYNGVPGKVNCYQGGCKRCNSCAPQGIALDECNCIHAEESAVLEVGVHMAKGSTLYTTLAPCRWCSKVIIAAGIFRVVYDEKYQHSESEAILKSEGIIYDKYIININNYK